MKLSQIAEASAAIEDGEWVESNILPGVWFRTRGMDSNPCVKSQVKNLKRLGWKNKKKTTAAERAYFNALTLYDAAILEWRGIQDDDGKDIAFSKERLAELLFENPDDLYGTRRINERLSVFYRAAFDAASEVGESKLDLEDEDEGNSGNSSSGDGPMAESAPNGRKTAKS